MSFHSSKVTENVQSIMSLKWQNCHVARQNSLKMSKKILITSQKQLKMTKKYQTAGKGHLKCLNVYVTRKIH